ncbi:Glycine-rich domain-containing 2 [Hyphodiscus hymeniophilus]|uniref:Glycine-rich domain-containing 2 n=1 Tax=Hyphodiscus hymeniophilus TaxID=353542 RepID=A0A9P6SPT7_9HELO|nr:Glycine-rich domain-containing 2 [Hyphodiscus hymeniophilus]
MPFGLNKHKGDKGLGTESYLPEKQGNIAPPSTKEAPPSYAQSDPIPADQVAELNSAFAALNLSAQHPDFPKADQCLAHLKLLSAFYALKEDVGYTDDLFGLSDSRCEILEGEQRNEALAKTREKRWALFVARAKERFEEWWVNVLCPREGGRRLLGKEMLITNPDFMSFTQKGRPQTWTVDMLPPLDVLMVWHSFILNPRNYLEDCVRFGLKDLWATGMPWAAVNEAIDTGFNYNVSQAGQDAFAKATRHSWFSSQDPMTKTLFCPRCTQRLDIPWTTCGKSEKPTIQEITDMTGTGYGDRDLSYMCDRCGGEVNHDLLRVAKFKKDTEYLIMKDWPLGGTILSPVTGSPDATTEKEWHRFDNTFPNRLVGMELRATIIELIDNDPSKKPCMSDVRELIEMAIASKSVIQKVHGGSALGSRLQRQERLAIRKMMSHYWENTSIFAMELGGAVIRQSVFVEKMHSIDWLHSPAARDTMDRLLNKYARFITLIQTYPLHTAVPTLDVDLGWHTHQLSPKQYYDYTVKKCKKFIDHDDKMEEDALSSGFEWTSKTYEKHFGEVYSECTCWYCETIRSKHISSTGKLFGTSKHEKALNNFYDSGAAKLCPPDNSAHISSHNAVKIAESASRAQIYSRLRARRQVELDEAYAKACKRAAAKGRPVPTRDVYYGGMGAWGYPYLMYGPYMSMGMYGGGMYYAGDPYCLPMGAGMVGNCCQGTCSGGVAAGGCGGPGGCGSAGGCSGGSMGACGGGGGGAACGGGGGGCGGGGA